MHIIHAASEKQPGDDTTGSVVIVWFSVEDYDRSISQKDNQTLQLFFDQMRLDQRYIDDTMDDALGTLSFKAAMDVFDFADRWVYIGCSTLPPCKMYILWN